MNDTFIVYKAGENGAGLNDFVAPQLDLQGSEDFSLSRLVVLVKGVETQAYSYDELTGVVHLDTDASLGDIVELRRFTDVQTPASVFPSILKLTTRALNKGFSQVLLKIQEMVSETKKALGLTVDPTTGEQVYDSGDHRITNVSDPVETNDAATKNYVDAADIIATSHSMKNTGGFWNAQNLQIKNLKGGTADTDAATIKDAKLVAQEASIHPPSSPDAPPAPTSVIATAKALSVDLEITFDNPPLDLKGFAIFLVDNSGNTGDMVATVAAYDGIAKTTVSNLPPDIPVTFRVFSYSTWVITSEDYTDSNTVSPLGMNGSNFIPGSIIGDAIDDSIARVADAITNINNDPNSVTIDANKISSDVMLVSQGILVGHAVDDINNFHGTTITEEAISTDLMRVNQGILVGGAKDDIGLNGLPLDHLAETVITPGTLSVKLNDGTTVISGDNILTGTVSADHIDVAGVISAGQILVQGDAASDIPPGTYVPGTLNDTSVTDGVSLVNAINHGSTSIRGGLIETAGLLAQFANTHSITTDMLQAGIIVSTDDLVNQINTHGSGTIDETKLNLSNYPTTTDVANSLLGYVQNSTLDNYATKDKLIDTINTVNQTGGETVIDGGLISTNFITANNIVVQPNLVADLNALEDGGTTVILPGLIDVDNLVVKHIDANVIETGMIKTGQINDTLVDPNGLLPTSIAGTAETVGSNLVNVKNLFATISPTPVGYNPLTSSPMHSYGQSIPNNLLGIFLGKTLTQGFIYRVLSRFSPYEMHDLGQFVGSGEFLRLYWSTSAGGASVPGTTVSETLYSKDIKHIIPGASYKVQYVLAGSGTSTLETVRFIVKAYNSYGIFLTNLLDEMSTSLSSTPIKILTGFTTTKEISFIKVEVTFTTEKINNSSAEIGFIQIELDKGEGYTTPDATSVNKFLPNSAASKSSPSIAGHTGTFSSICVSPYLIGSTFVNGTNIMSRENVGSVIYIEELGTGCIPYDFSVYRPTGSTPVYFSSETVPMASTDPSNSNVGHTFAMLIYNNTNTDLPAPYISIFSNSSPASDPIKSPMLKPGEYRVVSETKGASFYDDITISFYLGNLSAGLEILQTAWLPFGSPEQILGLAGAPNSVDKLSSIQNLKTKTAYASQSFRVPLYGIFPPSTSPVSTPGSIIFYVGNSKFYGFDGFQWKKMT